MYSASDLHGFYMSNKHIQELEAENMQLKKELARYERIMHKDFAIIDGHCCYKILANVEIEEVEFSTKSFCHTFICSGDIEYRDIFTDELMAVRHVERIPGEE